MDPSSVRTTGYTPVTGMQSVSNPVLSLDPFAITHPTAVQTALNAGASFARFDPSGKYIATGRSDGSAAIWDLDTKSPIRWLESHVKGVSSIDWSRNSRYVLTASRDWNIGIWDLASQSDPPCRRTTVRFDAPVISASFHPRNSNIILALLGTGEAYIIDLRKECKGRTELCEIVNSTEDEASTSRSRSAMTVARFDPSGKHVFVGTSSGTILVFNTRTKDMIARYKISGAGSMKGFDFAKNGRRLVANSSDRTIRQFNLPTHISPSDGKDFIEQELEPTHRFNDPISKIAWHAMSYSPDGEWLAGGAADAAAHKIYIWDISNDGQFATTLDGGREPLVHMHWHPRKSSIVSTTNQGTVLIWHCPTPERWGAFAGGFEEVDENAEYEEREDEFDIQDETEIALRKKQEEDEEVDILGGSEEDEPYWGVNPSGYMVGSQDENIKWADDDPDDDLPGWRMKLVMEVVQEDI